MSLTTQDKEDIAQIVSAIVLPQFKHIDIKFAEQDARFDAMDKRFDRVEAKMASNHTITIKHHLETRRQLGQLTRQYD